MIILNNSVAQKKIARMAIEVAEGNLGAEEIFLIGVKDNGIKIAAKIADLLPKYFEGKIHLIELEVDKKEYKNITLPIGTNLYHKNVVLIDDVANSGKVMMYALVPISLQYPAKIETLALLERQHKLFPIFINYVGLTVSTQAKQFIQVDFDGAQMQARLID